MSVLIIGAAGYVGSALYEALAPTHLVRCVDLERRGDPGKIPHWNLDYGDMSKGFIQSYDEIVLLAAHSSVRGCDNDPTGAFRNNVISFQHLLNLLDKRQRLIYASSSSIYSGFGATAASEDMDAGCLYDFTKFANDALATLSDKRCYGLRFGTVDGPSPNIRNDLMLNRMVDTALNDGFVQISNPKIRRPILGINDLTRAITAILDGDGAPGIYNLASFNSDVARLGAVVADQLNVPLILGEPSVAYDFEISSAKFEQAYGFAFTETAESIVQDLVRAAHGGNDRSDDAVHAVETLSGV